MHKRRIRAYFVDLKHVFNFNLFSFYGLLLTCELRHKHFTDH